MVQLICATLVKSPLICSHSLIIQLCQGLYLYTCSLNVSLHRIIISIPFPLMTAIWWALPHSARSYLCMNGWPRRAFSFSARTHTRTTSQWGHKHTCISRTALRVTLWAFHQLNRKMHYLPIFLWNIRYENLAIYYSHYDNYFFNILSQQQHINMQIRYSV